MKKKSRPVTLAFASHLLFPTMSDSEIGGEPAISCESRYQTYDFRTTLTMRLHGGVHEEGR